MNIQLSVTKAINSHNHFFRRQMKSLSVKSSAEKIKASSLVEMLDQAHFDLLETTGLTSNYPQPDAIKAIPKVWNLIKQVAKFDTKLEDLDYLGSEALNNGSLRIIDDVFFLERKLKSRAFPRINHDHPPKDH